MITYHFWTTFFLVGGLALFFVAANFWRKHNRQDFEEQCALSTLAIGSISMIGFGVWLIVGNIH